MQFSLYLQFLDRFIFILEIIFLLGKWFDSWAKNTAKIPGRSFIYNNISRSISSAGNQDSSFSLEGK